MRIKKKTSGRRKGNESSCKTCFSRPFFSLPALMIIVIGPAILRVMDVFKSDESIGNEIKNY